MMDNYDLLRKRNAELSEQITKLSKRIMEDNSFNERKRKELDSMFTSLNNISKEWNDMLKEVEEIKKKYTSIIEDTIKIKNLIYRQGTEIKLSFITRIKLFLIKHKKY